MPLMELTLDASSDVPKALFIRCIRTSDPSIQQFFLRLELLSGSRLWRTDVYEKHKPTVLDCTPIAFLEALETAFTPGDGAQPPRFTYKWSVEKSMLTLSERTSSGVAMKYTSLQFEEMEQQQNWYDVLHAVVVQSEQSCAETTRQRQRIQELETMILKKEALLETALTAKQRVEDELFTKFCAVLNGKKEEIDRLQRELAVATAATSSKTAYKSVATTRKRAAPGGRKKPVGAKLGKKKTKKLVSEEDSEEEEPEDHADKESEDESESEHSGEEEEEDSPKKRTTRSGKRDAIDAYNQLATQIPLSSQVCAAADVLDDLDAIMKTEVEYDDDQTAPGRMTRKRPPPPSAPRPRSPEKKIKTVQSRAPVKEPQAKRKPVSPPKKAIDSEEEDILDMLS